MATQLRDSKGSQTGCLFQFMEFGYLSPATPDFTQGQ